MVSQRPAKASVGESRLVGSSPTPSAEARTDRLASLDPGIAHYVDVLDAEGIQTFESCEGGDGHAFPAPTIRFYGVRGEGFRALAIALTLRLPVSDLRRYWQIVNGEPQGPYWEMTFSAPAEVTERPA